MDLANQNTDAQDGTVRPGRGQADPPDADTPDPKRWIALVVLLVAAFMDMLDVTIVNVALPRIQSTLHAGYSALQWMTAGYALAFALLLITGGRLGDVFGRKRMFTIGIVGFTIASLLCGVSRAPWQLAGSRILEGSMAAMMIPQVLAIIHVTFPRGERGKAFGMFGAISGLAAVLGMVLGGVLTQWNVFGLEWRPIFLINIPAGIAGLLVGARTIRESRAPWGTRLDLPGVGLATVGLLALLYPLVQGRGLHWPAWCFVSMAASVPLFAAFVVHERAVARRDGSPLLPIGLFRVRSFASGIGMHLLFNIGMGIFFLSWTLYMQLGLGWTPLRAGLSGVPFCLGAAPGAGLSVGVLAPRFGRKVLQLGAVIMIVGLVTYILAVRHFGADMSFWYQAPSLFVFGLGFGMVAGPLPDTVLTEVPDRDAGSASGFFNTNQQLGAALGIALASVVFFGVLGAQSRTAVDAVQPQLRVQLVTTGVMAHNGIDGIVSNFATCAKLSAQSDGSKPVVCPPQDATVQKNAAASAALAKSAVQARVLTFAGAFRIALGTIVGALLLMFAVTPLLPRKVVIRDPDAVPDPAAA